MRISDWSSDVCSSELSTGSNRRHFWANKCWADTDFPGLSLRRTDRPGCHVHMQYCSSIHNRSPGGTPHQTAGSRSGDRALWNIPARNAAKRTQIWVRPASRSGQRSEEHTSELQSLMRISYAVFCLKQKNKEQSETTT